MTGKLPRLPEKVGGETNIMIGIEYLKYFLQEIYSTPCGLTIYEAKFQNSDGSRGVVAGPHPSFLNDWEQVGRVVYSYEVMPENPSSRYDCTFVGFRERLESSDDDSSDVSESAKDVNVLTTADYLK